MLNSKSELHLMGNLNNGFSRCFRSNGARIPEMCGREKRQESSSATGLKLKIAQQMWMSFMTLLIQDYRSAWPSISQGLAHLHMSLSRWKLNCQISLVIL